VQPFGPGALIRMDRALTVPEESRWPLAVTHSPTARRADEDVTRRVTVVLLLTITVTGLPVSGCTVSVLPLTFVSLPRTIARLAGGPPPGPGLGLPRPGRGLNAPAPGPCPPPTPAGGVQLPFILSWTWNVRAVSAPLASVVPVATTQVPGTASVMLPAPAWRTDVLESYVTVTLPLCWSTVILPLPTWLTWPTTPFPKAPRPGLGDVRAALVVDAPAVLPMLPQPASTAAATPTTMMLALTSEEVLRPARRRLPPAVKNL